MTSRLAIQTETVVDSASPARRSDDPARGRESARRARAPVPAPRARPGARAQTQRTVLVVDDSADTREMYGSYLGHRGFGIYTAPDGEVAVELALAQRPDVIVMDLAMPRLNGISAVHRLKQ